MKGIHYKDILEIETDVTAVVTKVLKQDLEKGVEIVITNLLMFMNVLLLHNKLVSYK